LSANDVFFFSSLKEKLYYLSKSYFLGAFVGLEPISFSFLKKSGEDLPSSSLIVMYFDAYTPLLPKEALLNVALWNEDEGYNLDEPRLPEYPSRGVDGL
jgi:hypothetical protein